METVINLVKLFIEFVLHMDKHLPQIVSDIGIWSYLVLFVIIFIETGLVVTPFLPGDSLLFMAGAVAATTSLNIWALWVLMVLAAVLGDTANYWIGHYVGPKVFTQGSRWLKKEYLDRTHAFYQKHGGKTIFLARFIPIIRTFAPFVAGIGRMSYGYFISYNVIGGLVWVTVALGAGYFFGNLPFVKNNFSLVVVAIIFISVIPIIVEYFKGRSKPKETAPAQSTVDGEHL
jgi:membrane-associated protein